MDEEKSKCSECKSWPNTNIISPCFDCYDYSNFEEKEEE